MRGVLLVIVTDKATYRFPYPVCPEPPRGAVVVDDKNHVWRHLADGHWYGCYHCAELDYFIQPSEIFQWSWDGMLDDLYDVTFRVRMP
jgi:hypothetical protein